MTSRSHLRVLSRKLFVFSCFSFSILTLSCTATDTLESISEEPAVQTMVLGRFEAGNSVVVGSVKPTESANLYESLSVYLQAQGGAPLRAEAQVWGQWEKNASGDFLFKPSKFQRKPEVGRLGAILEKQLHSLELANGLPLGPVTALDKNVGPHIFILNELKLELLAGVKIFGKWVCDRKDGRLVKMGDARSLDCVLEGGELHFQGKGAHLGKLMKARLVGRIQGLRGIGDKAESGVEEIRLELAAEIRSPSPLIFKSSYHRLWCASSEQCPESEPQK